MLYSTVISIAYLASPDSSGSLGIIIYFLRLKYPAGKAAKWLINSRSRVFSLSRALRYLFSHHTVLNNHTFLIIKQPINQFIKSKRVEVGHLHPSKNS